MSRKKDDKGKAGGLEQVVHKAQDAVGAVAGQVAAATAGSNSANAFVANAALSDQYEREAARCALERAQTPGVRAFAALMLEDHTTSTHQLRSALRMNETRGVSPPPGRIDARRGSLLKHLDEAPDDAFEATYLDQQRASHEEAVTLYRGYAENGDNPQLRSFALGALPGLERHLEMVKRLKATH